MSAQGPPVTREDPDSTRPPDPSSVEAGLVDTEENSSPDSLATRAPSSIPETRFGLEPEGVHFEASILTRASSGSYDTVTPDAGPGTILDARSSEAIRGYELVDRIGEGGMGEVWKARQVKLNRIVALKMVLGGHRVGAKDLIRFLAEAEAVAAIRHPLVVQVFEYGDDAGRPFLAMEYLPGGSLADLIGRPDRFGPRAAAELLRSLAEAVQAAHDQGIVHRDLKPSNVLFDEDGRPKVTDFGLAKRAGGGDLTATQAVMGTPAYMAPEQARGDTKFVGPQADVYSLGVILYECLTGTRPFDGASHLGLLQRVAEEEPERPGKRVPGLPRDIELIALKCLAKDPAERYSTAASLASDLRKFADGEPVSVRAAGAVERAARWARRKPTLAAAYTLGLLAVFSLFWGGIAAWQWRAVEHARVAADRARADAVLQREKFERYEYGRTMQVAHQEWRENNVASARSLIHATRDVFRRWEWLFVRRLCHLELLLIKGHTAIVNSASFSPDGSRILTASLDGTARIWDARDGAQLLELKGHSGCVTSASFSPDGSRVVTAGWDKTTRVWDARSGAQLLAIDRIADGLASASFSPDGSRIVTGGFDGTARIWDARSGVALQVLDGKDCLIAASFSPDGSRVVTASLAGTAKVWDAASGSELAQLKGNSASLRAASFSPDGSRIVTGADDGTARVWDSRSGAEIRLLKGPSGGVSTASFSPDGSRIVTAGFDGVVTAWDAANGTELLTIKGDTNAISSASFSPDGSRIVTANLDGTAKVWDSRGGAEALILKGHGGGVNAASFSPDGSRVATGADDGTARVFDTSNGAELLVLKGLSGLVSAASFSPDGSRIVTAGEDKTARVWDARLGAELFTLKGHGAGLLAASFSPDGSRVVTAGKDMTVRIWDARDGAETLAITGFAGEVLSASFSPDGSRITTGGWGKSGQIFDARSGAELLTLNGHSGGVVSSSFSPDGHRVVTASFDNTAKIWDARTGALLYTLKGHTNGVKSAAFGPDGHRVVTAGWDETARVWDAWSGAEVLTLKGHAGFLNSASFSPDGSKIATTSRDRTARIWDSGSLRVPARVTELAPPSGKIR